VAAAGWCMWVQQAVEPLACCCLQCIQLVGLAHARHPVKLLFWAVCTACQLINRGRHQLQPAR
jgi:hypothetical protein